MKKGLISLLKGKVSMKVYELQAQKFMNLIQTGVITIPTSAHWLLITDVEISLAKNNIYISQ